MSILTAEQKLREKLEQAQQGWNATILLWEEQKPQRKRSNEKT